MNNDIEYMVQPNDTLYSIAKKFQTTVKQIMELNNLHNTILTTGQVLKIGKTEAYQPIEYSSYEHFLQHNIGKGLLKVHTLIGNLHLPLPNVKIEIYKIFPDKKHLFFTGYTDENGQIDNISLPTHLRRDDYLNGAAIYHLEASHNNYQNVNISEITIYDNIKSVQKIEMIPKDVLSLRGKYE